MLRFVGSVGSKALGFVGGAAAIALLCAGCPDSLTLDPVSSGSGPGGTGGSGGAAPIPCDSNSDCAPPVPVCDVVQHECKECLSAADCAVAKPGALCVYGACGCATEAETYCLGAQSCVDAMASATNCGACGHECYGACNAGQCADGWERTPAMGAPAPRNNHVAVAADGKMIIWGGQFANGTPTHSGGVLDLTTRTWTPMGESNVPTGRGLARAVWTGTQMVMWGGMTLNSTPLNSGGVYKLSTNTWKPMSKGIAPSPRSGHSMIWTGSRVIVWGGSDGAAGYYNDGAAYDVASDTWTPISANSAPTPRTGHVAVWTGQKMLIWGGTGALGPTDYLGDGAQYDPEVDSWTSITPANAPAARARAAVAWNDTGKEMIVWGGQGIAGVYADGARYQPGIDAWTLTAPEGAPEARSGATAIWAGGQFLVWGGANGAGAFLDSGGLFDPVSNKWKAMPTAPQGRAFHSAVDVGGKMVIWGGYNGSDFTSTGGIFDPLSVP